jgi:phosphoribosylformylglycinamidine cyclo-ligase
VYDPRKPYKHEIIRLIESTWKTPYVTVHAGTYPIIKKKFNAFEVQHTDGIGTKGEFHWQKRTFKNAVLDALAMNLNDLALVGAIPYALQNHIVLPEDDHEAILEIVRELAKVCKKRGIAMTGGETSIQNTATGMDISITVAGLIKKERKNKFKVGDVLIGFKSYGLHSNGLTKVRSLFGAGEWRDEFVAPTAIYLDQVLGILKKYHVSGMMHITGGAFTKLHDLLDGTDAIVQHPPALRPQAIFDELNSRGVSDEEMYKTFNCGIGFVVGVSEADAKKILKSVKNAGVVGMIVKGNGKVRITSAFGGGQIVL